MKKITSLIVIVITLCLVLASCKQNTDNIEIDDMEIEFPETINFPVNYIRGIEYGVTYSSHINEAFFEEYPCLDGYYGYYIDENLYLDRCTIQVNRLNINIPVIDIGVDERLLLYFQYEDEVYQKAKAYLMNNLDLSDAPVEEYNGYVFYDSFVTKKYSHSYLFNKFACNDSNNTIVLFGLHYNGHSKLNVDDYEWEEFLDKFYGGWYNFSE